MFYKKEFGLLKQTPKRFFKSPKLIFSTVFYFINFSEAVLISFDKFVKHDLDECNLYHSFCGFSKEFIIDGQPSEVFQP